MVRASVAVLAGLVVCTPATPPSPPPGDPFVPAREPDAPPPTCGHDGCWDQAATAAEARGDLDVAATLRGLAHRDGPTSARLDAWVAALLACGANHRARDALAAALTTSDQPTRTAREHRLKQLPDDPPRALAPDPPSPAVRALYEAGARGDPAALAAAGEHEPFHLAHAADLLWTRGDPRAARVLWSRARAAYADRGATLQLELVRRESYHDLAWDGDRIASEEPLSIRRDLDDRASLLRIMTQDGAEQRRLFFAEPARDSLFTAGARSVLRNERSGVIEYDAATGIPLRRVAPTADGPFDRFIAVGADAALLVLTRQGRQVSLFDAAGRVLAEHTVDEWQEHEPALALSPDGRLLAIGEEGPRVRVFARDALVHTWTRAAPRPAQWRFRIPETTGVTAIGFGPDELVAVENGGEIRRWTRTGWRPRPTRDPRCSRAEAQQSDPDDPVTAQQRVDCGRADRATLSPDAATLLAMSNSFSNTRLRAVASGRVLLSSTDMWTTHTFAPDGALLLSDGHDADELPPPTHRDEFRRWRPGAAALTGSFTPPGPYSIQRPDTALSADGTTLVVARPDGERLRHHVWDLATGAPRPALAPGEHLVALADGARAWIATGTDVVLRDLHAGTVHATVPADPREASVTPGSAPPGHALLIVSRAQKHAHHLVGPDGPRVVDLPHVAPLLSPDGEHLVAGERGQPLTLWSATTGAPTRELARTAAHARFSRDGSVLAWITDRSILQAQRLASADPPHAIVLPDAAVDLALSPSGDEVVVLTRQRLIRWKPGTDYLTYQTLLPGYPERLDISADGRTLTVKMGDERLEIYRNDEHLQRLATLLTLHGGGWLVIAHTGAVDGSDDAPERMITRISRGDERLALPGRLGWDGARVIGLIPHVLAGADIPPPGFVRPSR